jgi:hypothetical protein
MKNSIYLTSSGSTSTEMKLSGVGFIFKCRVSGYLLYIDIDDDRYIQIDDDIEILSGVGFSRVSG